MKHSTECISILERRFLTVDAIALTLEQIEQYELPPDPTKILDPRARNYVSKYGDTGWELDALPPDVLANVLEDKILEEIDLDKYEKVCAKEEEGREQLRELIHKL